MEDEILILSEFVRQSKNRLKVLKALRSEILIPTVISKRTGVNLNNVSRCLRELREKELIVLLNPENKRGRLYKINDSGKLVLNHLLQE